MNRIDKFLSDGFAVVVIAGLVVAGVRLFLRQSKRKKLSRRQKSINRGWKWPQRWRKRQRQRKPPITTLMRTETQFGSPKNKLKSNSQKAMLLKRNSNGKKKSEKPQKRRRRHGGKAERIGWNDSRSSQPLISKSNSIQSHLIQEKSLGEDGRKKRRTKPTGT